jgi:hypothetical protein
MIMPEGTSGNDWSFVRRAEQAIVAKAEDSASYMPFLYTLAAKKVLVGPKCAHSVVI